MSQKGTTCMDSDHRAVHILQVRSLPGIPDLQIRGMWMGSRLTKLLEEREKANISVLTLPLPNLQRRQDPLRVSGERGWFWKRWVRVSGKALEEDEGGRRFLEKTREIYRAGGGNPFGNSSDGYSSSFLEEKLNKHILRIHWPNRLWGFYLASFFLRLFLPLRTYFFFYHEQIMQERLTIYKPPCMKETLGVIIWRALLNEHSLHYSWIII